MSTQLTGAFLNMAQALARMENALDGITTVTINFGYSLHEARNAIHNAERRRLHGRARGRKRHRGTRR